MARDLADVSSDTAAFSASRVTMGRFEVDSPQVRFVAVPSTADVMKRKDVGNWPGSGEARVRASLLSIAQETLCLVGRRINHGSR